MKKFIVKMVLGFVFDSLIAVLQKHAKRSSSDVDDKLVAVIVNEQDAIKADILAHI